MRAYDVLYGFCAALVGVAFIYYLRDVLRDRTDHVRRIVCVDFALTVIAFTSAAPTVYVALGDVTGIPNIATLVVYVSVLSASVWFQAWLQAWSHPVEVARTRGRRRFIAYGPVIAAMVVLFIAGNVPEQRPIDFDAHYATTPFITEFLLLYYAGFAVAWIGAGMLGWRYAGIVRQPSLARGLRVISVGAAFALLYCVGKIAAVTGALIGWDLTRLSTVWAPASASLGAVVMTIGITLPRWEPRLTAAAYRLWAFRTLYPLWRAMYDADPGIALDPPPAGWRAAYGLRDLRHRLYRRVIEINDGRLTLLRDHFDPRVADAARQLGHDAGLTGDRLRATQEAAVLAAALRARADGTPAAESSMAWTVAAEPGREQLADELPWLTEVARAFRTSPIVRSAVDSTRSAASASEAGP